MESGSVLGTLFARAAASQTGVPAVRLSPPLPQDGTAPLWIASQMGHSEVVRVMLLRGADRDAARDVSARGTGPPGHPEAAPQSSGCGRWEGCSFSRQLTWPAPQTPPALQLENKVKVQFGGNLAGVLASCPPPGVTSGGTGGCDPL